MPRKVENDKGFLIIEMTNNEAKKVNFGIHNKGCICIDCNNIISDKLYYIAVLNDVMCKECYNKYIKVAKRYLEDNNTEKRRFDFIMNRLS